MPTGFYKRTKPSWNKGLSKGIDERVKHHSLAMKGKRVSPKTEFKKGNHPRTEWKKGKESPFWQGGKSFEAYGIEFNEDLKEVIRNRDRRKCFICEKTELENKEKLTIHHIDYNKKNNDLRNLVSLCRRCHMNTNYNRKKWKRKLGQQ